MKIIVAGCGYGAGNIGDEAILSGIIDMVSNRFPHSDIRVMSFNPKLTETMHGVKSFGWLALADPKSILNYLNQIKKADFVLFGGATLGDDTYGLRYPILSTSKMILLARLMGLNCGMFAIGVNKFRTRLGAGLVKLFYGATKLITVRDHESKKVCEEIGIAAGKVFECADAAYAMDPYDNESGALALIQRGLNPREKMVAVNVLNEIYEQYHYKEHIAHLCDYLIEKHGITPVFVNHEIRPGMDQAATNQTIQLVKNKNKVRILSSEFYNPRLMVAILSHFSFTISMRMHLLILSAMASIPVIGISRGDKVDNFFNQLGTDNVTNIQAFDLEKLKENIDEVLSNREYHINIIRKFCEERRKKALLNVDALEESMCRKN